MKSDSVERHVILEEYEGLIAQAESLKDRFVRRDAVFAASAVLERLPISDDLDQNRRSLSHLFHLASDWVMREFRTAQGPEGVFTYIDGLDRRRSTRPPHGGGPLMAAMSKISRASEALDEAARIQRGRPRAYRPRLPGRYCKGNLRDGRGRRTRTATLRYFSTAKTSPHRQRTGYEKRTVDEPETEAVIRGPREGFIESLRSQHGADPPATAHASVQGGDHARRPRSLAPTSRSATSGTWRLTPSSRK